MLRLTIHTFYLFICILFVSCHKDVVSEQNDGTVNKYIFSIIDDILVYKDNSHAAFTCLIEYEGHIYLAFREGNSHRPTSVEEYGKLRIMKLENGKWFTVALLSHKDMDLRDPFFLVKDETLYLFSGYNRFNKDGNYCHAGTAYSTLTQYGWSPMQNISHDVPHVIWLWKVREYQGSLYGIGYLEGEEPVLLSSKDGKQWMTVCVLGVDGVVSEADLAFVADSVYVCLRKDSPVGSPSLWGKAMFPFTEFVWTEMDFSIASPELHYIVDTKQMLLAGREYDLGRENIPDSINVSLFSIDGEDISRIHVFNTGRLGDKGYPSLLFFL